MTVGHRALRTFFSPLICAALSGLLIAGSGAAQTTILYCDFDNEPLDQIIVNGGPEAGQPTYLDRIEARVRSYPMDTPSLEILDHWGNGARYVNFQFLNWWEIDQGHLTIRADLWFKSIGNYGINVWSSIGFTNRFLSLYFNQFGNVIYSDSDSPVASLLGTYSTGQSQVLEIDYDLDARTYDLWFAGVQLLDDESLAPFDAGIGKVLIGHTSDSDTLGGFYLGDLTVTATIVPTLVAPTSFGRVKALFE